MKTYKIDLSLILSNNTSRILLVLLLTQVTSFCQDTIFQNEMKYTVPVLNNKKQILTFQNNPDDFNKQNIKSSQYPVQLLQTSNVYIINSSTTTQSENSVFISPLDKNHILNSNNSSDWPATILYGADYFTSSNGGTSWSGSIQGVGGGTNVNRGDPAAVIGRYDPNSDGTGRLFVNFIGNNGQRVGYSDDNGLNWTVSIAQPCTSGCIVLDKGHLWIDNKLYKKNGTSNPYQGRLYLAWTEFSSNPNNNQIMFTYSTDNGTTWQTPVNISTGVNALINLGVNIQTGPDGEVYACWAVYDQFTTSDHYEVAIGFNTSLDGGQTWGTATRIISNIKGIRNSPASISGDIPVCGNLNDFHIIPELGGGKYMRTNSFPSMTVNKQNGNMYIIWTNRGIPGTNTGDPDIYIIKSTNGGSNWNTPIKVNQDTQGNGKDQWFPWMACDEASGALVSIYYDSRDFTNNDRVNTYISHSYDDGSTWTDNKINDLSTDWDGHGIDGKCSPPTALFGIGYAGDYLGIDVFHGLVIPLWSDKRNANMLAFTNPFDISCPQNLNLTSGNYNITDEGGNFTYDAAYSVSGTITVAGTGSSYMIYGGTSAGSVLMTAGNEVNINEGFESDGEFYAYTGSCTNFSQRVDNEFASSETSPSPLLADASGNNFPVRIYPNPSINGKIQSYIPLITSDEHLENIQPAIISIYNSMGVEIYQSKVNEQVSEINLSSNPKGLYLIKVMKGGQVYNGKIILQ